MAQYPHTDWDTIYDTKDFIQRRLEDVAVFTLKVLGHLAIPIEALLDEINDEDAANARWGVVNEL